VRSRDPTVVLSRSALRVPQSGADDDHYAVSRQPAVWLLDPDEGIYVLIAGRRYLAARPEIDRIECRILDAATLEEARAMVAKHPRSRPSVKQLARLAKKIAKLPSPSPEERAFLAAVEYATAGLVKSWPGRIASLDGKVLAPDAD
jgi:hypothetical protein